jgi:hypothetical protein
MCVTNWINCALTFGIVVFACLQWICSDKTRKTELFKYRIKHIQDFKTFWDELHKNIIYIAQVKAEYIITSDYPEERYKILKFLDDHSEFTSCYFNENIYKKELEFTRNLGNLLPQSNVDATNCKMNLSEFENIENNYKELLQEFLKLIK